MFMDNILHSMIRKMKLPDIEFIINLGDWPLVNSKVKFFSNIVIIELYLKNN